MYERSMQFIDQTLTFIRSHLEADFSMGQGQETSAFLSATPIVSPKMHEI